jgi:8-oxo-dGTP pyrophosphatase MutT (NUDIX family)
MSWALHADVQAVVSSWSPPGPAAADARNRTLTLLRDGPVAMTRAHRPGHVTASTVVVDAAADRILLCLHARIGRWVQLGGHCEPSDQTLAAAALREATEESGIAGLVLNPVPIGIDIHTVADCSSTGRSVHYDVRYAALAPPGAVERISAESHALGWFRPDRLPEPLAHATAPLVAPALAAAQAIPPAPLPRCGHRPGCPDDAG